MEEPGERAEPEVTSPNLEPKKVEPSNTDTNINSQNNTGMAVDDCQKMSNEGSLQETDTKSRVDSGIGNHPSSSHSGANTSASSINRKTWSARLRDKLEKRERNTTMAASQESNEKVPRKDCKGQDTALHKACPKKPGQKKNKHKSHRVNVSGSGTKIGIGSAGIGGVIAGGKPAIGSKNTSYHLTPSLLEDVLNEKKMSLMRSPEVIDHLQRLQQNVNISKFLSTTPVIKREDNSGGDHVKTERDSSVSDDKDVTIGHVVIMNIKKEEEEEKKGTGSAKSYHEQTPQNPQCVEENDNEGTEGKLEHPKDLSCSKATDIDQGICQKLNTSEGVMDISNG